MIQDHLKEQIAMALWHRFAPESHEEWSEETHQAEYLDAADGVLVFVRAELAQARAQIERVRASLGPLIDAFDGVPHASYHDARPFVNVPNDVRSKGTMNTITWGQMRAIIAAVSSTVGQPEPLMEANQAQHDWRDDKKRPAVFTRNGKLEICRCRDCRSLPPQDRGPRA